MMAGITPISYFSGFSSSISPKIALCFCCCNQRTPCRSCYSFSPKTSLSFCCFNQRRIFTSSYRNLCKVLQDSPLSVSAAVTREPTAKEFLQHQGQLTQTHNLRSIYSPSGFPRFKGSRRVISYTVNISAQMSEDPKRINLDHTVDALRKLWDSFPQPVKNFPWTTVFGNFSTLILGLVYAVAKCLCVPLLAVSSLSEMSYCAHERKMVLIPFPLLAGIAVAQILKDTAMELSQDLKGGEFPWHLLSIAIVFMLLKLPGPYYPYWGRIFIPHFANGGLWSTLWFAFLWYRRPQEASKSAPETSLEENQPEQKTI